MAGGREDAGPAERDKDTSPSKAGWSSLATGQVQIQVCLEGPASLRNAGLKITQHAQTYGNKRAYDAERHLRPPPRFVVVS